MVHIHARGPYPREQHRTGNLTSSVLLAGRIATWASDNFLGSKYDQYNNDDDE